MSKSTSKENDKPQRFENINKTELKIFRKSSFLEFYLSKKVKLSKQFPYLGDCTFKGNVWIYF